jgi:hypothetical protein
LRIGWRSGTEAWLSGGARAPPSGCDEDGWTTKCSRRDGVAAAICEGDTGCGGGTAGGRKRSAPAAQSSPVATVADLKSKLPAWIDDDAALGGAVAPVALLLAPGPNGCRFADGGRGRRVNNDSEALTIGSSGGGGCSIIAAAVPLASAPKAAALSHASIDSRRGVGSGGGSIFLFSLETLTFLLSGVRSKLCSFCPTHG